MARAYQLFYYSTLGWEYKEPQIGIAFCFTVYSVTGLLTKTLKNTVKKNTVPAVGDGLQYERGGLAEASRQYGQCRIVERGKKRVRLVKNFTIFQIIKNL